MNKIKFLRNIFVLLVIAIITVACNNGTGGSSSSPAVKIDVSMGGEVLANQNDVPLDPIIILTFSQPMDPQTINSSTISLAAKSGSSVLISSITANDTNTTFYFSPANNLVKNTKYTVSLTSGIKSQAGNAIAATSFSFTTGSSSIPVVAMVDPANKDTDVSKSPNITLQFNQTVKNVNINTVILRKESETGTPIAINHILAGDNDTYTFSPTSLLESYTTYYVILTNGITNTANTQLKSTVFSFTTGNSASPNVQMIKPSANGTNVSLTPNITLYFSESVQNVNTTTVTLHENSPTGKALSIGKIIAGANNTYVLSPITPLKINTTYYVVLTNGIMSLHNHKLANINFNFTTSGQFVDVGIPDFSINSNYNASFSIDQNGTPYILYSESYNGGYMELSVMKFDGESWVYVGNPNFAKNVFSNDYVLQLAPNGTPYVYYSEFTKDVFSGVSIAKFDGESWIKLDYKMFPTGVVNSVFNKFRIASDGTLYLLSTPSNDAQTVVISKFDGTKWSVVTERVFPNLANLEFAPSSDNKPYVIYTNSSGSDRRGINVIKFDGESWSYVGAAITNGFGFASVGQDRTSLAIAPDGTPYFARNDHFGGIGLDPGLTYYSQVMKFNGESWVNLGGRFLNVSSSRDSLAIAPNGTPYFSYRGVSPTDYTHYTGVYLAIFDGTNWVNLDGFNYAASGINPTGIGDSRMVISPDGIPYIYGASLSTSLNSIVNTVKRF